MSDHATDWRTFLARFTRLGTLGFGGPPGHVLLMRQQWVETRVVPTDEFNDAFASVSLLPGPASTQLALWLGWRLRGYLGLLVAAFLFITPAVLLVLFFSWLTLGPGHPTALLAAALGAAAVVPAVALRAARDLFRSYSFPTLARGRQIRVAPRMLRVEVVDTPRCKRRYRDLDPVDRDTETKNPVIRCGCCRNRPGVEKFVTVHAYLLVETLFICGA